MKMRKRRHEIEYETGDVSPTELKQAIQDVKVFLDKIRDTLDLKKETPN